MSCRGNSTARCWPYLLTLALACPVLLAALPDRVREATPGAGVQPADTVAAGRSEVFLASSEATRLTPLPRSVSDAQVLDDAVDHEQEPTSGKAGNMYGACSFLLALVPIFHVVFQAFTDSGIVVVARPQPQVDPQPCNFEDKMVLVASIEHDITYDLDAAKPEKAKVSAGGLGKVAGQLQRIHPTDLISVHPVYKDTKYGYERGVADMPVEKKRDWHEDDNINVTVDGLRQTVQVFRRTVAPQTGQEGTSPQVTYLMLEHPWFRHRTGIYLDQPGSVATLRFFSLWNQAVGVLIARENPTVYQCPDYHTALAPWYALRACGQRRPPPRVTVVLHNAEYQGAISSQQLRNKQVRRLARILDLPTPLVRKHMMIEGGFNMLQAGMEYMLITQRGYGVCAVSNTYAEESKVKHRVLWPLPEVVGLDNPMLENERPKNPSAPEAPPPLAERRARAKAKLYEHKDFRPAEEGEGQMGKGFLRNDPNARIFVFLGRWVKQKGMDYIADIAEWMVSKHENLQLAIIGPPGDSFGTYSALKLQILATDPRYAGRLKVLPEFYNINQVDPDVKFAFDFCFMPSRDEPFGYVDIEFGWFGALTVGAITGGLGKVPGIYYIPSNVNSASHICHLFKGCVDRAMALTNRQLTAIAEEATRYSFPVEKWQASLLALYNQAEDWGARVGTDTRFLRSWPEVFELFDRAPVLENRHVPVRFGARRSLGCTLDPSPVAFSQQQMEEQAMRERVGVATGAIQSFSLHGGEAVEEAMTEQEEFIRKEVDDSAIQEAVAELVRREASDGRAGCRCREPPSASDVLSVTQWNAMKDGEFRERMSLRPTEPFFGACKCLTKYLTSWLAGDFFGLKRIDFFVALHYLTAPLLQAYCVAVLPKPDLNRWPMVVGAVVLPFAVVFWVKLSTVLEPNRVMALAVILRIPLLFLYTIASHLNLPLDSVLARLVLFCLLNFLSGADQIFVYYNFMGAAIGDISKLALRMGMCNGILGATSFFGQVAISYAVRTLPSDYTGGNSPLSFLGFILDLVLAFFYTCAPAPYREFCLPEWDLAAMWNHRRTLKYLAANIVLGAVTDPTVSGSATTIWRSALEPFANRGFLGDDPNMTYMWLLPVFMAVTVILWSYVLYRSPNRSASMVKAFAFLLAPPALLRCCMALTVKNNTDYITAIDVLFLLSLFLDVIRSTCMYIALLSVVGSRWRFVSFLTVALFFRYGLAAFVRLVITALLGTEDVDSYTFALEWMPLLAGVSVIQWLFSIGGFFVFDRESSALLTVAKRKLARDSNRGLQEYLRRLEG